ncbi:hypothetical protein OH76DRAFT_607069 [Lentinus brumalis]|uniref:DNA helicase Pif1-like 2B domain-containing protein n=1 Tax=Lentinus brumalis TaxID=2498619 RepID=A0A371DUU4_9APHY|nr:hypothetical protein OH76DRAFT_607069 [Polyporus brumalis]
MKRPLSFSISSRVRSSTTMGSSPRSCEFVLSTAEWLHGTYSLRFRSASYPTRDEAGSANSRRLKALQGEPRNYKALDVPGRDKNGRTYPADRVERALKDAIVPKILPLKIGAQVMLVKNIIQGLLVNGSLGRVVAFYKPRDALEKGIEIAIPDNQQGLRKALGKEDDKNDAGAGGRADAKRPHEKLQEQAQAEQREQTLKKILAYNDVWPCVQFHSGPLMLCVPLSFEVINADGNIEAVREQVPLILAWALSIHKSQGQTLEHVRVNLDRTFEKGQGA